MPAITVVAPVLPGKANVARELGKLVMGEKQKDHTESRASIGIVRERVDFYASPQGDAIAVYLEGNDPAWANRQFAASKKPYDVWFKQQAKEASGIDFNTPLPPVEHLYEARIGGPGRELMAWAAPVPPGKTQAAKSFFHELATTRARDVLTSMKQEGKTHESVWLMPTPMGEFVTGITEATDLRKSLQHIATSKDAFETWYRGKLVEVFGLDLAKNPFPMPETLFDWQWR